MKKEYWELSDSDVEKYVNIEKWKIEDFLNSDIDTIKYIAAPFGTGKTSFAKYVVT